MLNKFIPHSLALLLLCGCGTDNVLTQEEIAIQNRASATVTDILFNHDLDTQASYHVRKDGYVVIKFDKTVPKQTYTRVVRLLRSKKEINGVHAEQAGVEVCPLL